MFITKRGGGGAGLSCPSGFVDLKRTSSPISFRLMSFTLTDTVKRLDVASYLGISLK